MNEELEKLGLDSGNSVVIGSGILQALEIRKSNDIDLVVKQGDYERLKRSRKFGIVENHGREILRNDKFEICTNWFVLGKSYEFESFEKDSVVIDNTRYITLDFLYRVKRSWLEQENVRQKDIEDVKLMVKYLKEKHD